MNPLDEQLNLSDSLDDITNNDVDDFEKMLNDFISKEFDEEITNSQQEIEELHELDKLSPQETIATNQADSPAEQETASIDLQEHEFSLFRAYKNFMYAVSMLCEEKKLNTPQMHLNETNLMPRFKKSAGKAVSKDVLKCWDLMLKLFPKEVQNINPSSTDDQLLDFAEQCENENLQLAIISYVETMIELEGCEIDYQMRKLKYERKKLEKEIYEAHQRHIERSKRYIAAIKAKNFPIDAERLVNNYFRLSNKDPEGSFKALTTNPATFAPIDFSKIKDKFFGLIKVKPQDGIRINQKIGEFLKKLKA